MPERIEFSNWRSLWLVLLVYVLVYLVPLEWRPLIMPDETRYAEIPREMLASGNWVVPKLNGLRYFEKPPLGYWANALAMKIFGETRMAVRLPGALAAGLTALMIGAFVWRVFRQQRLVVYAVIIYLSFLSVYMIGTFSVLDNILALFLTGALLAFYLGETDNTRGRRGWWLLSGIMVGLAFLTKGFLALVIPALVIGPWLLWMRRFMGIFIYGAWMLIGALPVVLPWAWMIHLQEGDFWRYFFWVEHVQRFTQSTPGQHPEPLYYFFLWLPLLAFPWMALLPAGISGLSQQKLKNGSKQFLIIWLVAPFIFFSLSSGKLATYILPVFPALAILLAVGLHRYFEQGKSMAFDLGTIFNGLTFIFVAIAIMLVQSLEISQPFYAPHENLKRWISIGLMLSGALICILLAVTNSSPRKLWVTPLIMLPAVVWILVAVPDQIIARKAPVLFLRTLASEVQPSTHLISDGSVIRAVSWAFKRNDIDQISVHELEYGLTYADARHRLLRPKHFRQRVESSLSQGNSVLLICKHSCPHDLELQLPKSSQKFSNEFFHAWLVKP